MKHRLTIPFGDQPLDIDIHGWVREHGWHLTSWTHERFGYTSRDANIVITLEPYGYPLMTITARSGSTLVYDDAEQSMGVTLIPEPRDVIPPQPEDAQPR